MKTEIIRIDTENIDYDKIKYAGNVLKNGGLVAFPTETVYGIGANALNSEAVKNIFIAKGRPADNPLIAHISDFAQLDMLATKVPESAKKLISAFWPGPLTIIFQKFPNIPNEVTAGLDTIAVRMPLHQVALALIDVAGVPIAAPSANISGLPSPTCSEDVIEDLYGRVDIIIDSDNSIIGVESTVLNLSNSSPIILRPGAITAEQISSVIGSKISYIENQNTIASNKSPLCPGIKYSHYSPEAEVIVIQGNLDNIRDSIYKLVKEYERKKLKTGILSTKQTNSYYSGFDNVICLGDRNNPETISASLFKALRNMDRLGADIVFAEGIPETGLGVAIMNRLKKSAGNKVLNSDDPDSLDSFIKNHKDKILFICTGNTCRSCMAEAIFNNLNNELYKKPYEAFSRGIYATGGAASGNAMAVTQKLYSIDLSNHLSKTITASDLRKSKIALTMTKAHKEALLRAFPIHKQKIYTLSEYVNCGSEKEQDILDPYGMAINKYNDCAKQIAVLIERLIEKL